jgi:hypothetical protein
VKEQDMSSPAIVLMTDPARCSQSDVHHLVQALLEIQQMGEHATPQAFCDHPEAAREFIDAYAQAYPQLVLEDREIPTPAHLQTLISTGQVGAFGQPAEPAPPEDLVPPAEPNGANGVPIVVLTMGSSQVLLDALQQAPAIRESIRLIDVAPEREDVLSVAVAEAVAGRGIDGGSPDHERSPMELDDIPGVAKADLTGVALQDDHISLDVVETAEVLRTEPPGYAQGDQYQPAWVAPPAPAVSPAPAVIVERTGTAAPDAGPAGTTGTESPSEAASDLASPPVAPPVIPPVDQPLSAMPTTADVVAPVAVEQVEAGEQTIEPEAQAPDDAADAGGKVDGPAAGAAGDGKGTAGEKKSAARNERDSSDDADDVGDKAGKGAMEPDDVEYPPVGSLAAGGDVLYPAHDRDDPRGVLRELANVLLDEAMFDPELSADLAEAQRGEGVPAPVRQEAPLAPRQDGDVVKFEEAHDVGEQDSEDQLADAIARPLHDSDL